jgi:hypothetical protein
VRDIKFSGDLLGTEILANKTQTLQLLVGKFDSVTQYFGHASFHLLCDVNMPFQPTICNRQILPSGLLPV